VDEVFAKATSSLVLGFAAIRPIWFPSTRRELMQLVLRDRICIASFRQSLLHSNSMVSFFYSAEGMQTDAVNMTAASSFMCR